MGEYLSPGVYVEEMAGPRPIEGASTSTAAFVGYTAKGEVGKAKFVTSFGEYERFFGGFQVEDTVRTPFAVKNFFDEGGNKAWVVKHGPETIPAANIAKGSASTSFTITAKRPEIDDKYSVRIYKGTLDYDGEFTLTFYIDTPQMDSDELTPIKFAEISNLTMEKLYKQSEAVLATAKTAAGTINLNDLFTIEDVDNTIAVPPISENPIAFTGGTAVVKGIDAKLATSEELAVHNAVFTSTIDEEYSVRVTAETEPEEVTLEVFNSAGAKVAEAENVVIGTHISKTISGQLSISGGLHSIFPIMVKPINLKDPIIQELGLKVEFLNSNAEFFLTAINNNDGTANLEIRQNDPLSSPIDTINNVALGKNLSTELSPLPEGLSISGPLTSKPATSGYKKYAISPYSGTSSDLARYGIVTELDELVETYAISASALDPHTNTVTLTLTKDGIVVNSLENVGLGSDISGLSIDHKVKIEGLLLAIPTSSMPFDIKPDTGVDTSALTQCGIYSTVLEYVDSYSIEVVKDGPNTDLVARKGLSDEKTIKDVKPATDLSTINVQTGITLSGYLNATTVAGTYDLSDDTHIATLLTFGITVPKTAAGYSLVLTATGPSAYSVTTTKTNEADIPVPSVMAIPDLSALNIVNANGKGLTVSGTLTSLPVETYAEYAITGLVAAVIADSGSAPTANFDDSAFRVEAISDGKWANDVKISITSTGTTDGNGSQLFTLSVIENNIEVETFEDITLDARNKKAYIETVIEEKSDYIRIIENSVQPEKEIALGTFPLKGGANTLFSGDIEISTFKKYLDDLDGISMLITPDVTSASGQKNGASYCDNRKDCFFIASTNEKTIKNLQDFKTDLGGMSRCALYAPYLKQTHPTNNAIVEVPAAGAVAGIYARTDVNRGVFKAPAGTIDGQVRTALALAHPFSKGEQDMLNPLGINLIRNFPGAGNIIWGTRTTAADAQWRYVPVRRLVMYIEKSIENSIQWSVFEPNDPKLWSQLKREISGFLRGVWKDGGLFGASEDQAFFVKIDEENNPQSSRDAGKLIVNIGVAPVKPAEFVIIRIEQTQSDA